MKKLFFVLALVAVYGVSMAANNSAVSSNMGTKTMIVTQINDNQTASFDNEKSKESKAAATETKAKSEGCADAKAKGEGCADSKAKSGCCSGEAKKDCGSAEKKKQ